MELIIFGICHSLLFRYGVKRCIFCVCVFVPCCTLFTWLLTSHRNLFPDHCSRKLDTKQSVLPEEIFAGLDEF